jgi:hypothetical protein
LSDFALVSPRSIPVPPFQFPIGNEARNSHQNGENAAWPNANPPENSTSALPAGHDRKQLTQRGVRWARAPRYHRNFSAT